MGHIPKMKRRDQVWLARVQRHMFDLLTFDPELGGQDFTGTYQYMDCYLASSVVAVVISCCEGFCPLESNNGSIVCPFDE
jgi:hypothetical protein